MSVLRCAGCGVAGQAPTIVYDRTQEPVLPVLRPAFGWRDDGRPALLCELCRGSATTRHRVRPRPPGDRV